MGAFFYHIFLILFAVGIRIAALFNKKAKLWLRGRKNIHEKISAWRKAIGPEEKLIWMHCASLGEFEQGRPLLEAVRKKYPGYKILVTFFSPSGYEIRKDFCEADGIFYLPADGKGNAAEFTRILQPSLVLWVKYDYWYYFLRELHARKIPVLLVSAIFLESFSFFKWYGGLWRKMLQFFTKIFVQNEASLVLLENARLSANAVVCGDTRFDRVIAIAEKKNELPEMLTDFCKGHRIIVAGSTWEEDEEELVHYVKAHPAIRFIIAPHEMDAERLAEAKKLFGNALFWSEYERANTDVQVLIIDNIGMLAKLYVLADICYIGGGFNDSGIHNVPEAAVYGKPVVFGPEYSKFSEARDLVEREGAFSVENALELEALLDKLFSDEALLRKAGAVSREYIYENKGATENILRYIQENRLLTN